MDQLDLHNSEDHRNCLIRFIEHHRPQGSLRNRVTIVFDGNTEFDSRMQVKTADVVFSKGESADEKIKKMVDAATNKKNIIVVTNDRAIQYAVRALGAKVSSVEEFLGKVTNRSKKFIVSREDGCMNKHISKTLESAITSEFEGIWLKK